MKENFIGEIELGKRQWLRVYEKYGDSGVVYIDIRIWAANSEGEVFPTKKGIFIPKEDTMKLLNLLIMSTEEEL